MPEMSARFELVLGDNTTTDLPSSESDALTVPADSYFVLPFNLDVAHGVVVTYSTAQLLCRVADLVVLSIVDGVPAEIVLPPGVVVLSHRGELAQLADGSSVLRKIVAGLTPALEVRSPTTGSAVRFVWLERAQAERVWKHTVGGTERVFVAESGGVDLILGEAAASPLLHLRGNASELRYV